MAQKNLSAILKGRQSFGARAENEDKKDERRSFSADSFDESDFSTLMKPKSEDWKIRPEKCTLEFNLQTCNFAIFFET